MDDRRFDQLVRLLGQGASRRTVFKGLLGLGGAGLAAGAVAGEVDARTARTRPTIPPPPPPGPTTTTTSTTTPPCPPDHERCSDNSLCCPTGTCAYSGNQAICCDGSSGRGDTVCGLECCQDPQQCCDGECCGELAVCLSQVFAGYAEEFCCPAALTCDGGCCDGECYNSQGPKLVLNGFPVSAAFFAQECCPPGGAVCQGMANAACCDDITEQCCLRDGVAICIAANACCGDDDCPGECDLCDLSDPLNSACTDHTSICQANRGPCSVCLSGACFDHDELCSPPDTCTAPDCINGICQTTSVCTAPDASCCGDDPAGCTNLQTDRFNCGSCGVDCTIEFGDDGICCDGLCENGPFCGCDVSDDCDTCETCMSGKCFPIPFGEVCGEPGNAICCSGETPGCCIRDGSPICLFGRACCDDSNCTAGECDICDVSQGAASSCINSNAVCEELYGPGCTCAVGQCSCPTTTTSTTTTTRDPNLCLERDMSCEVANNLCCEGLGCIGITGEEPHCDLCLQDSDRCSHDSACCAGMRCLNGECGVPECFETSDCGACTICNARGQCEEVAEGTDPNNDCGVCRTCRTGEFEVFGCFDVDNGTLEPHGECPNANDVCCGGGCRGADTCACVTNADCGPCMRCDGDVCVVDCTQNDGGTVSCCSGCTFCQSTPEAFNFGRCQDSDSLCEVGCERCFEGVCRGSCGPCFRCDPDDPNANIDGCVFDCNEAAGAAFSCCEEFKRSGNCGRTFCRADGSCAVEADPSEICAPCQSCVERFGEFNCSNVANGSVDPSGNCPAEAGVCCDGVCTSVENCDCTNDDDCGPCLGCSGGQCVSDCNREPDGGRCCFGCQECETDSGICRDRNANCPGECRDCEGGICRVDHSDCGDCELCVNECGPSDYCGACLFNCNYELGVADCCEDTGACGIPFCGPEGECAYTAGDCAGDCEICDGPEGGPFHCRTDLNCACANDDNECGPCGTCTAEGCVKLADGSPRDGFEGICCDGVYFDNPFAECCDHQTCNAINWRFCGADHECTDCLTDAHCIVPELPCWTGTCGGSQCELDTVPIGTIVPEGICCHNAEFDLVPIAGNCCSDVHCASGWHCCGNTCQEGRCSCENDNECAPCESCGVTACEPRSDGPPRDGFFGICCGGVYFDGDCCDDTHCTEAPWLFCPVHTCVECLNDAHCDTGNICRADFCTDVRFCDWFPEENGQVTGGRCCDGDFLEGAECCYDSDCSGTDTPYCDAPLGPRVCIECRINEHCTEPGASCNAGVCTTETTTPTPCDPPSLVRCESDGQCHHCCGTDTSNCPNVGGYGDAECFICNENLLCAEGPQGVVCPREGTPPVGFCSGVTCEPCIEKDTNCSVHSHCCSGFCDFENQLGPRCGDPSTTTTAAPGYACEQIGGTLLANGTCVQQCTEFGQCEALCDGLCLSLNSGMLCAAGGFAAQNCPAGGDDECPFGYACVSLTSGHLCQQVCALLPEPATTTTSTTTSTTSTTLPPCETGLIRCPAPDGPCAECCGDDAANCPNVTTSSDTECIVCSGGQANRCIPGNHNGHCVVDSTGRDGYCSSGQCSPCQDNDVTCNGNDFVCCSDFCRPADNRCADPAFPECNPGANRSCYDGPAGTQDVGVCRGGLQFCNTQGTAWGACMGQVLPSAEICDGLDNDCNGQVDDGIVCNLAEPAGATCIARDICLQGECGAVDAGCGQTIDCGACPPPLSSCLDEGAGCTTDVDCCHGACRGVLCRDRGRKTCQEACLS